MAATPTALQSLVLISHCASFSSIASIQGLRLALYVHCIASHLLFTEGVEVINLEFRQVVIYCRERGIDHTPHLLLEFQNGSGIDQ